MSTILSAFSHVLMAVYGVVIVVQPSVGESNPAVAERVVTSLHQLAKQLTILIALKLLDGRSSCYFTDTVTDTITDTAPSGTDIFSARLLLLQPKKQEVKIR